MSSFTQEEYEAAGKRAAIAINTNNQKADLD
jgi:hypothetical protein